MKELIKKGPDVSQATMVGEPPLLDPEPVAPSRVLQQEFSPPSSGEKTLGVEIVSNNPASESAPAIVNPLAPVGSRPDPSNEQPPADPNELKPNTGADPNELKPVDSGSDASLPPPAQVNEISQGSSSSVQTKADESTPASDQDISSSKKKKKKGLSKINPF